MSMCTSEQLTCMRHIEHVTDQTRGLTSLHITTATRQGGKPRPDLPHEQERIQFPFHDSSERNRLFVYYESRKREIKRPLLFIMNQKSER